MIYAFPESFICLIFAWVVVCAIQLPLPFKSRSNKSEATLERNRAARIKNRIDSRYHQLGPVSPEEKIVLLMFIVLVLLWIFKSPQIITGTGFFLSCLFYKQTSSRIFKNFTDEISTANKARLYGQ